MGRRGGWGGGSGWGGVSGWGGGIAWEFQDILFLIKTCRLSLPDAITKNPSKHITWPQGNLCIWTVNYCEGVECMRGRGYNSGV